MKRAVQLKWPDAATGIRALFRLEPPLETDDGPQEHVVVSVVETDGVPHSFVFAADAGGEIQRWSELDATKDNNDIRKALAALGYDSIPLVGADSSSQAKH